MFMQVFTVIERFKKSNKRFSRRSNSAKGSQGEIYRLNFIIVRNSIVSSKKYKTFS